MTDTSTTVQQASGGLTITVDWDPSVADASAGFKPAVLAAAQFYESRFVNPIHITINVGYGEIDGTPLDSGTVGESLADGALFDYGAVRAGLAQNATSADQTQAVASLPASDPTGGGRFFVSDAEAKALGLIADNTRIDGSVGFSAGTAFAYDPADRAVPGQLDFIGLAEHEISEVMGRMAGLAQDGSYAVQDLFRYSADGTRQLVGGRPAYFSIDGGASALDNFSTVAGADYGDWAQSAGNDAFTAFATLGVEGTVSAADLTEMNALGYQRVGPATVATGNIIDGVHNQTVILDNPAVQDPATVGATGVVSVTGADGIVGAAGYAWNLTNLGTIASTQAGITLAAGGTLDNGGAITGYGAGVVISGGAGTVTNSGTIAASAAAGAGVYLGGDGSRLTNAGAIADPGGVAVDFAGNDSSLTVDPGAVFTGAVEAGGNADTIALTAGALAAGSQPGRLLGLGAKFSGFGALAVAHGAVWQLSGPGRGSAVVNDGTITVRGHSLAVGTVTSDPGSFGFARVGDSGTASFAGAVGTRERVGFTAGGGTLRLLQPLRFLAAILGFGAGGTIDLAHQPADQVGFADHHLTVTDAGTVVTDLRLAGQHASGDFALSPDGHGGTDITLSSSATAVLFAKG